MTSKQCICCGELKPLEAFSRNKGMRDGRINKCKPCCVEYTRRHRAEMPTEELQALRHDEHEKRVARGKYKRERSLEEIRAQHDPVARKVVALRHFHKKRANAAAPTELDELVFEEAVRLSRDRTRATGIKWEIDHVVPVKGKAACGLHNAFNLQVVPKRWNELKSNTKIEYFFARA